MRIDWASVAVGDEQVSLAPDRTLAGNRESKNARVVATFPADDLGAGQRIDPPQAGAVGQVAVDLAGLQGGVIASVRADPMSGA